MQLLRRKLSGKTRSLRRSFAYYYSKNRISLTCQWTTELISIPRLLFSLFDKCLSSAGSLFTSLLDWTIPVCGATFKLIFMEKIQRSSWTKDVEHTQLTAAATAAGYVVKPQEKRKSRLESLLLLVVLTFASWSFLSTSSVGSSSYYQSLLWSDTRQIVKKPTPSYKQGEIEWLSCGDNIECGRLE